jgi:hypothetical protein
LHMHTLHTELRRSDEVQRSQPPRDPTDLAREMKSERERAIRETTIDALTGSVAMELLGVLAEEQVIGGEERRRIMN